jgi:hypothetical protein
VQSFIFAGEFLMRLVRFAFLSLSAAIALGSNVASRAQANPTSSKSAEISAFGAYMGSKTDYGQRSNEGVAVGVDFTIFPRFPVAPSLEVRAADASAQDASEKSLLVGVRIQRDIHRKLHPYGDFLIGAGKITFHPAPSPDYTSDLGRAISYGGGINIDVTRSFALKLDAQKQSWDFGLKNEYSPNLGEYVLHPITAMVGVTYIIPFRILNRHSDFH